MRVRVFLPAAEPLDPSRPVAWKLFDARGGLLREGSATLDAIPRARDVEAIVPAERVLFARLRLPRVNAATIRELLPFAVEDRLLADPSHIHAVTGATNARGETVVAVIDREWLRGAGETLARAGLEPSRAWPEGALLPRAAGRWDVVLGATRGLLVDDEGVAATFDRPAEGGLPLAIRVAIDESAAIGARPTKLVVHAMEGASLPDAARWGADSGATVETGEPWEKLAAGPVAEGAIDLLQGIARARREGPRIPVAAFAIAGAIVALQLAFTAADAWRLSRERRALEARQEAVFREAFPEAKVVVDPALQMARNRAELERSRGLPGGDPFLAQLSKAARADAAPARSVTWSDGRLEVKR